MKKIGVEDLFCLSFKDNMGNPDYSLCAVPFILKCPDRKIEELNNYLKQIFINRQNVESLISYAVNHNYIKIDNNQFHITSNGEELLNSLTEPSKKFDSLWRDFKQYIALYFKQTFNKNIDPLIIDKKIISFISAPIIYGLEEKYKNIIPLPYEELFEYEKLEFAQLLYEVSLKEELKEVLRVLQQGIIILIALIIPKSGKNSNNNTKNKPRIYIDNIFLGRLFHWCSKWEYESAHTLFNTLKQLNFDIYIFSISLDAIQETIEAFTISLNNRQTIRYGSVYHYMKHDTKIEISTIQHFTLLCHKMEELEIQIDSSLDNMPVDINSDLYKLVEKYRKKYLKISDERMFSDKTLKPIYTDHAYKIVKYFINGRSKDQGKSLLGYDKIFLTFAKAISFSFQDSIKRSYVWSPVMWVYPFSILLLFDKWINNVNDLSKIAEALVLDYYSNLGLTEKTQEALTRFFNNSEISEADTTKMLIKVSSPSGCSSIEKIKDWKNPMRELEQQDLLLKEQYGNVIAQVQELKKQQLELEDYYKQNIQKLTGELIEHKKILKESNKEQEKLLSDFGDKDKNKSRDWGKYIRIFLILYITIRPPFPITHQDIGWRFIEVVICFFIINFILYCKKMFKLEKFSIKIPFFSAWFKAKNSSKE